VKSTTTARVTRPVARKAASSRAKARTLTRSALGPAVRTARAQTRRRTKGADPGGPGGPFNLGPARAGNPDRRLRVTAVFVVVIFVVFAGRLVQLQTFDSDTLSAEALKARSHTTTLFAHRGDILDTDGNVLAQTVERRNITVDQTLVPLYNENAAVSGDDKGAAGAARKLAPILRLSIAAVARALVGSKRFAYVAKDVEPTVWSDVSALLIPGIYSEQASRRTYPGASVASNVLGFMNGAGVPQSGIEKAQNKLLSGKDGTITYEQGKNGQQIATGLTTETEPVDGKNVQLTLNRDLQFKAQEALNTLKKTAEADSVSLVAMRPDGEILALADAPTFDSNDPGKAKIANLGNRSLATAFEPGSTSKVITAAAAIQEGVATPTTKLIVPGSIDAPGGPIHDSEVHGDEKLTFAGVLAKSSNVGTVKIGERMSATTMYDYLRKFGLGSKTGVGLSESAGFIGSPQTWDGRTRLNLLFGQGISVTALQSASVYATIANDGVRVAPKLIKAVTGADGKLDPEPAGKATRVVSAKTAEEVRLMLEGVVGDGGTATTAEIPGYRVAGKTGTAQAYDASCGCYSGYTASFVGMAPADDPKLVVAVYVQNPKNGHYGGTLAAPVFQQIMSYALTIEKIEPTGTKKPVLPIEW
jgi:cell division protein FtsI (penicillin-binding protein 3)